MKKIVGEVKMQIEEDNQEKALDEKVKSKTEELPCILSSSWCKEVWREIAGDTATFFHLSVPQSPDLCEGLHTSVHHRRETALLCAPLRKVYRFPTEDQRWLTVRDELSETPLSFSLPRQLLSVLVHEHATR